MRESILAACLFAAWLNAAAANVVFIDNQSTQLSTRQQLEAAAGFYGLTMEVRSVQTEKDGDALLRSFHNPDLLAVVINANALPMLNQRSFQAALHEWHPKIPILIAGINENSNGEFIKQWSSGVIIGGEKSVVTKDVGWYVVASGSEVTQQLGGSRLPLLASDPSYLKIKNESRTTRLMEMIYGSSKLPVFARTVADGRNVFFATETSAADIPVTSDPYRQQAVFASLAPMMLFLHYGADEHAWHTPGSYANFTIDDLWLREPYGHVNYEELLQQAELHNFHATVAFIPWNFDRSQPKMVSVFRKHPDRLSICVHGNNHVHQEFGPLDSHPLQGQVENMRQGLARMERFSALTQIPYDAVMVFPHSIAPEATFSELKRNHYLATANSLNVPSDAAAPADADFVLRTATLRFGNFPSLRRYSAETDIPQTQLAIDAFLGNPMLFYAHEGFFAPGIDAFDKTADLVNKLQPTMQWQSLGSIARHLYLERLRDDGNYDIRTFSATIQIANTHKRDATFLIEKDEDFSQPLIVLVDGSVYPYERSDSKLRLVLPIRGGETKEVAIQYNNDLGLANVNIAKNSFRTNAIRLLSDFRDNTVSNSELGRHFIKSYAENGRLWNLAMAALIVMMICAMSVWFGRRRRKTFRGEGRSFPSSQLS